MASTDFLSNLVLTDQLTVPLLLIVTALFLLSSLYKPQPLVHPILLGRQSDAGRVRKPGESAIYRNYGTGMMGRVSFPENACIFHLTRLLQLPAKPSNEVQLISDLVKPDFDAPRTLWSTSVSHF